ncbi:MAG: enoyl-ACP reductase [Acidiferrobacterales bacterium]
MGFLSGKRALIVGVAGDRSIAWGVAKAMHREGAELAYTYQNERLKARVEKLGSQTNSDIFIPCDVASDQQIEGVFAHLDDYWDGLDIIVHSVAYAPREELTGSILDTMSRNGFLLAQEISAYSFAALGKAGRVMMQDRTGAMLTLTYIGAVRTVPNYNVMGLAKASLEATVRYMAQALGPEGIRVNAISAGPIKTLAAAGISDFKKMLDYYEKMAPLGRGVTIDEVGNVAAFLCSDLASAITGEITYVDGGFNTVALGQGLMEQAG